MKKAQITVFIIIAIVLLFSSPIYRSLEVLTPIAPPANPAIPPNWLKS